VEEVGGGRLEEAVAGVGRVVHLQFAMS
jgi:hypothetical protein